MNDAPAKEWEWQCVCGQWISAGWWRHSHIAQKQASREDMVAARMRGDLDAMAASETLCDTYLRTGTELKRIAEHGC